MPHCPSFAHWLLQSPGSLWIFPCPAIFSQVLIFSFCQARSRQPLRYFQRSGLHANCLSMARLPPTYIMHLVSFAQSGLHHFGSFKFRREKDCSSSASGYGQAKQLPKEGKKKWFASLFLAENFCVWADLWDILKDELHVIAVVLDKTSFLNYKFSEPTFITQFIMSCSSATESYTSFLNLLHFQFKCNSCIGQYFDLYSSQTQWKGRERQRLQKSYSRHECRAPLAG